jgi:hypothetical protein
LVQGEAFELAVDIRKRSPIFGQWVGGILLEESKEHSSEGRGFLLLYLPYIGTNLPPVSPLPQVSHASLHHWGERSQPGYDPQRSLASHGFLKTSFILDQI